MLSSMSIPFTIICIFIVEFETEIVIKTLINLWFGPIYKLIKMSCPISLALPTNQRLLVLLKYQNVDRNALLRCASSVISTAVR